MLKLRLTTCVLIGQIALATAAVAADTSPTSTDPDTAGVATVEESSTTAGTFDTLSPGNQKIANALFENQTIGSSGEQAWSLDQIATAKTSGEGWGEIFQQMKADGLIQAKNLGQLVSGHYTLPTTTTASTSVVITSGTGASSAFGSGSAKVNHGHTDGSDIGGGSGGGSSHGAGIGLGHATLVGSAGSMGAGSHGFGGGNGHAYGH